MSCGTAGEKLPAAHDDIDISGVELETIADSAGHLGGDHTRARAEKRVIDRLPGRLLLTIGRRMHSTGFWVPRPQLCWRWRLPNGLLLAISQTVVCVRSPCQWLVLPSRTAYQQVSCLPMIIAAAEREVLLGPDDLSAQLEAARRETGGDDLAVQGPEPHIGGIPGEQSIGFPPVGAIVVEHLAVRELAPAEVAARPPARVVTDPVRRIGDHQMRLGSRQHRGDIGRAGAVAAANPVVAQQPDVAAAA